MPVTLPPLTRRRWISNAAASAAWLGTRTLSAALSSETQTWVLFADTHIAADDALRARDVCMAENLTRCVNQVLKLDQKPFGVLVNGDCAYLDGQGDDYATFVRLINPLREAAVQVHCTLGNHDNRKNFIGALTNVQDVRPLEGRHVQVIPSALMNWVLLDSLDQVNSTPGLLGDAQLGWLDRTLHMLPARPTVVLAHHNPQSPMPAGKKPTGLLDSDALFEVLAAHKAKVRAFVYGHTHTWLHSVHAATGIHLINLPPVAYVFNKERPSGWVVARADRQQMELELRSLNPAHDQHREKVIIPWAV